MIQIQMTKTKDRLPFVSGMGLLDFGFVSNFGFRASNLFASLTLDWGLVSLLMIVYIATIVLRLLPFHLVG